MTDKLTDHEGAEVGHLVVKKTVKSNYENAGCFGTENKEKTRRIFPTEKRGEGTGRGSQG